MVCGMQLAIGLNRYIKASRDEYLALKSSYFSDAKALRGTTYRHWPLSCRIFFSMHNSAIRVLPLAVGIDSTKLWPFKTSELKTVF